ncbi:SAM-dependent methyltransferase [Deinococcus koreensis]|uniref:Class I SAM-dependent methyltransferase n=1 Tax=Deinococcus koreensis TaxID=2054903 RepID=A0A2K3UWG4_9DEIO|nr:methyltransferase domain-containing protein [Deinococcus koreensis]PNY80861.1 class I SAM-dependent methyltransferase [Deinococcus koreensis]
MDFLEFFAIVERDRDLLNPFSPEKLERIAGYADLQDGLRVLDIGSGKGAMLRAWAGRWAITGTGLELNPAFVQEARERAQREGVADRLTFVPGRALDFIPDPAGYDVATCLGATFALGGFTESLAWMRPLVRPGGVLIVGDVFLGQAASPDELEREGWKELLTVAERHAQIGAAGLEVVGFAASSMDDWDHYSSLMWAAVDDWAAQFPEHPDRTEVLEQVRAGQERYFRFERAHLAWGVWVTRPATP